MDRFSNILVTQTLSVGMEKLKPILFPILAEVLRADGQTIDGIYERNDEALRAKKVLSRTKAGLSCPVRLIRQAPRPRSARTEFTIMWISRTGRSNSVFLRVRIQTAGRWHALLQVTTVLGLLYPHR